MLRVSLASAVLQSSSPHISSLEGRIRPLLAWKRLQQQLKEDFGLCHLISCLFNLKLNGISKVDYYQRKYWNPHYSSWQKDTQVRTLFDWFCRSVIEEGKVVFLPRCAYNCMIKCIWEWVEKCKIAKWCELSYSSQFVDFHRLTLYCNLNLAFLNSIQTLLFGCKQLWNCIQDNAFKYISNQV